MHLEEIAIPSSKSIFARAMILAARTKGNIRILCEDLCDDQRTMLQCLEALGVKIECIHGGLLVHGCGGKFSDCSLDVKNAGTAARFLPVMLAFCGGNYLFRSSTRMAHRPMDLSLIQKCGVDIEYLEKEGTFPFRLRSNRTTLQEVSVSTDESTQFASALLLAGGFNGKPLVLHLTGQRTKSPYINLTLEILKAFHIPYLRSGDEITVFPQTGSPSVFAVEADLSCACYFCALALLCRTEFLLKNCDLRSSQGDLKFLRMLEKRGLMLTQTEQGIFADGRNVESFKGFDEEFTDFSDQTLTAAVLAPFAATPSRLRNIGHIRFQECDRVEAIIRNLNALGVPAHTDGEDIYIMPTSVKPATIETYGDHRVAMAFALVGLKEGNITITDPACCKKTFDAYFDIIRSLT